MFPKIICGYTLDFGYDGECINLTPLTEVNKKTNTTQF